MSWQKVTLVPCSVNLTSKRDKDGHVSATINNARIIIGFMTMISLFSEISICFPPGTCTSYSESGFLYVFTITLNMSRLMGKPTICIGENKDADQLRGNREADQRLCFRYSDSTIPLLLKSEISSF